MNFARSAVFASLSLATLLASPLAAQQAAAPAPDAPSGVPEASGPIEQIIITSERRESTVQDTPIAVSAFDASALLEQGILNPADLQSHVPGFFYTEGGGGSPITQIAIRGVGNENVTAGSDPGVAYHFDGVYLGRPTAAATDFFDLERVEVLRGPQGTLYGRNATGGSINVISRKPTDEPDMFGDFTYGNYDQIRLRAAGGGALTDWLKVRLAFVRDKHDGYLVNDAPASACGGSCEDIDVEDVWGGRFHVLIEPTENTEVLFTAQYHEDQGAVGQTRRDPLPTSVFVPWLPVPIYNPYAGAQPSSGDLRHVSQDDAAILDMQAELYTLRVEHRFSDLRLTWLGSRQKQKWYQRADNDFSELGFTTTDWREPSDQWLTEVQLASESDSPLQWLAGAFYMQEDVAMRFFFIDTFAFRFENGGDITTESWALFGEGAYDFEQIGAPITVRLGLRYSNDEKSGDDFISFTAGPVPPTPIAPTVPFQLGKEWNRLTGRLVGEYRPRDDLMLYASVSKGYKSGGVLIGNPVLFAASNVYDPEDIWAYELGAKSQLFDGRLQANLSGFYNDYEDLQVFILFGFGAIVENAAKAEVYGIESEFVAVPVDSLRLDATFAWTNAEYTDFSTVDPTFGGPSQQLAGNQLNRTPEFSINLGAQYEISLGERGTLTPRFDYRWQDETFFRPQNIARDRVAPWDRWDARLRWTGPESEYGQFSAELYVRNMEDDDLIMNISTGASSVGFPEQTVLHPPRVYGVTIGWSY